jgi:hypothetical protein
MGIKLWVETTILESPSTADHDFFWVKAIERLLLSACSYPTLLLLVPMKPT